MPDNVMRTRRLKNPGRFAADADTLAMQWTSVTPAINLAIHFGAARVVLLGVDGNFAADGRRHCHDDRYPWPYVPGCFDRHAEEFRRIAPSARDMDVEIVNANPDSRIDAWPRMPIGTIPARRERAA